MPPLQFPLRWESTGDKWWYASPIDCAAANGLYDVVRELLYIDTNLLIKLTSLRRIRRLETVWDDESQFNDVAKNRALVAKKLLLEGEKTKRGCGNSLIQAGYGGWLLYTAASSGDLDFVMELLDRDPLLVFGEGEYGVTDILYAAARGKNSEVFRVLLDFAILPRCYLNEGDLEEQLGELGSSFKWDMINRAVHSAARGGNLEILRELIGDCSDILVYRDVQGSTLLHTAAGRGQIEVVKNLVTSFDIISSTDSQGNTALHVVAYRGYLAIVEFLICVSPSLASLPNYCGDTFLHMAVAGFRTPGFRRLDKQIELIKHLIDGKFANVLNIINVTNNDGRTALHIAITENVHCDLVKLLMSVPSINLNIRDANRMTPLDLLKQRPRSASSEILIMQLISAGGISNHCDYNNTARNTLVSCMKMQGIGNSPGSSFRIPDAEIFLYTDIERTSNGSYDQTVKEFNNCSGEITQFNSANSENKNKSGSISYTARRLKFLLQWPQKKEKNAASTEPRDNDSEMFGMCTAFEANPIPLRQKYSKFSCLPNNKRTLSIGSGNFPSPSAKEKFTAGLMQGVIKAMPHLNFGAQSPSSSLSGLSISSSPPSMDEQKNVSNGKAQLRNDRQGSFNPKMMNQYFCVGAHGVAVEDSYKCVKPNQNLKAF